MNEPVILVEGESDKAALEATAALLGLDLASASIRVMNGATNVVRLLVEVVAAGSRVAGMYDVGEQAHFVRALCAAGLTEERKPEALERLGFFACDPDLEAELIRALGADRVLQVIERQGDDIRRFRSLQQMPEWRGRRVEDQLRRWFGSGSRRKLRYAPLLVHAMHGDEIPRPLRRSLQHVLLT